MRGLQGRGANQCTQSAKIIPFPGNHVRFAPLATSQTSDGQRSGRSSPRGTPVSRSIGKTNSAGTPFLERSSQYQTCDCVVPMRSAKGFCPPASSHALLSGSFVMESPYPVLGRFQPVTLSATSNLEFGRITYMVDTTAQGIGNRIKSRRLKLGLSQPKLAKILKIPQQTIGGWEKGASKRPRLLLELSKALCTTQEWLLSESGPEEVVPAISKGQIAATIDSLDPRLVPAALEFLRNLSEKRTEAA
jgi:transcriptional regulator with XRE-family HTH domain